MGIRDRVRLSVQERKELATIEAMVEAGDPELAAALTNRSGLAARLCRAWLGTRWLGPVLVGLGLGAVFGTISIATWLSLLGVAVAGLGLGVWLVTWRRSVPPRPARRSHETPAS